MGLLVVVAFLVILAVFGIIGWFVADSRDSRDWRPMDWPTARRRM
jgi:hypothetical protein